MKINQKDIRLAAQAMREYLTSQNKNDGWDIDKLARIALEAVADR